MKAKLFLTLTGLFALSIVSILIGVFTEIELIISIGGVSAFALFVLFVLISLYQALFKAKDNEKAN